MLLGAIAVAAGVLLGDSVARASICYYCGSNSATVGDGIVFDELNGGGDQRPNGPKVTGARLADGTDVIVKVHRHFLYAQAKRGPRIYRGQELVGLIVDLKMDDGRAYQIRLMSVWDGCLNTDTQCHDKERKDQPPTQCQRQTFWVSPFEEVPYYDFKVRKTSRRTGVGALDPEDPKAGNDPRRGRDRPLVISAPAKAEGAKADRYGYGSCGGRCQEEEFQEHICKGPYRSDDTLWKNIDATAIVFAGDHYDTAEKTVSKIDEKKGWFNLACAGTAPYKMHMLRHTEAGSITPDGTPRNTTLPQRTAMLKAITADYCGDGRGWTGDGTPLYWADAQGFYQWPSANILGEPDSRGIEAIWGPTGALCLNTPRRKPDPPAPLSTYPQCNAPSVERSVVESICSSSTPKRTYTIAPPGPGKAASTVGKIPECDAAWAEWWKREYEKSPKGAFPYVLTVNREKHADAVKYCNPPGNPVPPAH
ncbi:MAG TPA: ADYC domain-containing protein [Polyangia bacterium]|jgi:hypothetical protein